MIIVFGSVNLDLVARVARLPQPGETIAGESFATLPGGKGANQALAARRAGARVAMAGAVGDDPYASKALSGLSAAGVDLAWVTRVAAPTGVALIHVDAAGQNAITIVAGANASVDPAAVPDSALGPGTTLVLQLEVPMKAVCAIASRAKQRGARVVLNAAPAHSLPDALLASVDVLIVNALEAAAIADSLFMPTTSPDFTAAVHRHYGCAVVLTLGASGAIAAVDDALLTVEAPEVQVIDTTGAGDALVGALAAALDRGADWVHAIAEGVAAGSLACTAAGAQASLPTLAAIEPMTTSVLEGVRSCPLR